jgi:hypothetical protein
MGDRKYVAIGTMLNVATLLIGLACGFYLGTLHSETAHAQASPQIEEVTPTIMFGSGGTNLLLAHEVYADRVVVNGFDIMIMNEGIINYLNTRIGAERPDLQRVIDDSRAQKMYRIKTPEQPKPPEKKEQPK